MKQIDVLAKAVVSEKSRTNLGSSVYAFLVTKQASKNLVKAAIEKQFPVQVTKVNIMSLPPKKKRIASTRKFANLASGKKAIVWLKKGQVIGLLSDKPKNKKTLPVSKQVSQEGKEA